MTATTGPNHSDEPNDLKLAELEAQETALRRSRTTIREAFEESRKRTEILRTTLDVLGAEVKRASAAVRDHERAKEGES